MTGIADTVIASTLFGQDIRFWMTVGVASLVKTLFSPKTMALRDTIAGIITGVATAYYGWEPLMRRFETLTLADKDLVVIGLVISGEHIMRAIMTYGPGRINRVIKGAISK